MLFNSQKSRRPWIDLNHDPNLNAFGKCMFPGSPALRLILRIVSTTTEVRQYLDDLHYKRGWITSYNIRHNFSSPIRIDELISEAIRFDASLSALIKNTEESLSEVFDKWTIDEIIEQNITPILNELRIIERDAKQLMSRRIWPQRPLPYLAISNLVTKSIDQINEN